MSCLLSGKINTLCHKMISSLFHLVVWIVACVKSVPMIRKYTPFKGGAGVGAPLKLTDSWGFNFPRHESSESLESLTLVSLYRFDKRKLDGSPELSRVFSFCNISFSMNGLNGYQYRYNFSTFSLQSKPQCTFEIMNLKLFRHLKVK